MSILHESTTIILQFFAEGEEMREQTVNTVKSEGCFKKESEETKEHDPRTAARLSPNERALKPTL